MSLRSGGQSSLVSHAFGPHLGAVKGWTRRVMPPGSGNSTQLLCGQGPGGTWPAEAEILGSDSGWEVAGLTCRSRTGEERRGQFQR